MPAAILRQLALAPGTRRVTVLEDFRGSASGLAALLAEDGYEPVVGGMSWGSLQSAAPERNAATILAGHAVSSTLAAACAELRRRQPVIPLLCVLASFEPADAVRLLECGADDVLLRDLDPTELKARIAAHVRRAMPERGGEPAAAGAGEQPGQETFDGVVVDPTAREVRVHGRPVRLGRLEFELVQYLSRNAGVAISWDQVSTRLYGPSADLSVQRLEILVRRVRAKLATGAGPSNLVAVPGWGYRWDRRRPSPATARAS